MQAETPTETKTEAIAVIGAGAFVPGFEGLKGWAQSSPDPEFETPGAAIVPARQRRRASLLSKAFAEAYAEALTASGEAPSEIASVFGSALGEAATMIGLLDQMWSETAMLSPMKFATSVHNAASGMLSIATENRGFTTSLGADFDTPAMALFEGIGLVLAEDRPVLVCCGDEAPPDELVPDGSGWSLLSAAIALAPVAQAPSGSPRISNLEIARPTLEASGAEGPLGRNPCIGLLDLVTAIEHGASGILRLDRGAGRGFSVRIEPASTAR
jgi:hypothetical protein